MAKKNLQIVSAELLIELKKDAAYKSFVDRQELFKQIGLEIARVRKAKKLSVDQLAKKLDKPATAVSRMEKGEYKAYTLRILMELAQALGVRMKILFEQ